MEIKRLSSTVGTWFDAGLRRRVRGTIYQYEIQDSRSGWSTIEVCTSESPPKAIVRLVNSEQIGGVYEQLRQKTDVFQPCREDAETYYHPLKVGYLDELGRLHYHRPSEMEEVPREIEQSYQLDLYENVALHSECTSFRGKLVVLVPKSDLEQMARLFILEMVHPIFDVS